MKILITGGAGTLGSSLIDHWQPQGHDLLIIDNFATGKRGNVPAVERVELIEGSISKYSLVANVFHQFQPDICIHAAASYKDPSDWVEDAQTNVIGTINVVKAAEQNSVHRLINFQTALTYGRPSKIPIEESTPSRPFTSYGISKTAAEDYLLMSSIPSLSLRLANVTGPRLSIGPIPTFYQRLKAGKPCFCSDSSRDFLDLRDFLAFMDLAIQPTAPTGVYNVSTGEQISIHQIFKAVCKHLNLDPEQDVPIVPVGSDDVPNVVLDPSKAQQDFHWHAAIGFDEMMTSMLGWYDQHGVTDVFSHLKSTSEQSFDQ
jgi:UDP-glucose 4-epimerase